VSWIKLQIHPEHDKVLALADLTGATPERVFAAAVRWFRWADEHAEDASIGLSRRAFRDVTRWKGDGLADAMLHERVDWLTEANGILSPTRWDTHMSQGAKVRAMDARRKKRGGSSGFDPEENGYTEQEQDKKKQRGAAAAAARTRVCSVDGSDPRITALIGVGIAKTNAVRLVENHAPELATVENYNARANEPGVKYPAGFVAKAIREAWETQEPRSDPGAPTLSQAARDAFADGLRRAETKLTITGGAA
jgi:hypothetical protein